MRTALEELEEFLDADAGLRAQAVDHTNTIERELDTVEALEALLDVIEKNPTISTEAYEAGRMARLFSVTGTGAAPTAIVPAFEQGSDSNVAFEGIVGSMETGLSHVANSTNALLNLSMTRALGFGTMVKALRLRLNELEAKLDKMEDPSGTFEVTVVTEDDSALDAKQLVARLEDEQKVLEELNSRFVTRLGDIGKQFAEMLTALANPEGSYFDAVIRHFNEFNGDVLKNLVATKAFENKPDSRNVFHSRAFLNDEMLSVRLYNGTINQDAKRSKVRDAIGKIAFSRTSYGTVHEVESGPQTVQFDRSDLTDLRRVLASARHNVASMEKYANHMISSLRELNQFTQKLFKGYEVGKAAGMGFVHGMITNQSIIHSLLKLVPGAFGGRFTAALATGLGWGAIAWVTIDIQRWLFRTILGMVSTGMKLQYKITAFVNWYVEHGYDLSVDNVKTSIQILERATKD